MMNIIRGEKMEKRESLIELYYDCEKHTRYLVDGELCQFCNGECHLDCMDVDLYTE